MSFLSIVIVNHNTKETLRSCLENLKQVIPENTEVIVVDNGSTDGAPDMVDENFDWVKLIRSENIGLAAGSNIGLEASIGDYILYLGSDAFPKEGVLSGVTNYFDDNPGIGAATCKLVLRDGSPDMDAHRGFPTPWVAFTHFSGLGKLFPKSKLFGGYFMGWETLNKPHEIDLCISHFMIIRRKVFEDIGKWDEDYFVYGEDVDFCYRVKQAGWKIMYLPMWEVVHYKGTGVGIRKETADISTASNETKTRMSKERTKSMRIFYKKHFTNSQSKIMGSIVLFGISILEAIRTIKQKLLK